MSLPLESSSPRREPESPETDGGSGLSTAFIALIGGVAGGAPQLVIPTATLLELIGNTVAGAFVIAMMDKMLLRATLSGKNLRKGRILLIVAVAFTLSSVTYRSPARVFQTVFDVAPDREKVRGLQAMAYTHGHLGNLAYDLAFQAEPVTMHNMLEQLDKLPSELWDESRESWPAFVARNLPPRSPLLPIATQFKNPQGRTWTTTRDGRTSTTVLFRDAADGRTLVHHISG